MYRIETYRIEDATKKDREPIAITGTIKSEVDASNIRNYMNSTFKHTYNVMVRV